MALPAQSYVWFRLRHVVGLWVQDVTALPATAILYDTQNETRPPLPYVGLERRDFPFEHFDSELIREVTTSSTLTVTASSAGETAAFTLFGLRYVYTLGAGETTEDARDALLAAVSGDLVRSISGTAVGFQPCTATGSGVDSIDFAGLGLGPVRIVPVEGCSVGSETLAYRNIQAGIRRAVVRLHLYWPEQQVDFETIDEYAEVLRSSLLREETASWLQARGVGVDNPARISVQDASAVSGGARQRRKFLDVIFNAQSRVYRADTGMAGATFSGVEVLV
jgi:hypothetical protein